VKDVSVPNARKTTRQKPEVRIILIYLVFAGLWIFFSDRALSLFTKQRPFAATAMANV
jgi:hypothetical protein